MTSMQNNIEIDLASISEWIFKDDKKEYKLSKDEFIAKFLTNKECDHDFRNMIFLSYPAQKRCIKCGYTEYLI